MPNRDKGLIERAYLNGWGKTRLRERRIDRARRREQERREVAEQIASGRTVRERPSRGAR